MEVELQQARVMHVQELEKLEKDVLIKIIKQLQQDYFELPDNVRYFWDRRFVPAVIVQRNYQDYFGFVTGANFELKEIELSTVVKRYDMTKDKYLKEKRTMLMPASAMLSFNVVHEQEDADKPTGSPDESEEK